MKRGMGHGEAGFVITSCSAGLSIKPRSHLSTEHGARRMRARHNAQMRRKEGEEGSGQSWFSHGYFLEVALWNHEYLG